VVRLPLLCPADIARNGLPDHCSSPCAELLCSHFIANGGQKDQAGAKRNVEESEAELDWGKLF
jgi:hypothetical protein